MLCEPSDFAWGELVVVLKNFGYLEQGTGKTGGSRRKFAHANGGAVYLHKPHPSGILKAYQVRQIIEYLKKKGLA